MTYHLFRSHCYFHWPRNFSGPILHTFKYNWKHNLHTYIVHTQNTVGTYMNWRFKCDYSDFFKHSKVDNSVTCMRAFSYNEVYSWSQCNDAEFFSRYVRKMSMRWKVGGGSWLIYFPEVTLAGMMENQFVIGLTITMLRGCARRAAVVVSIGCITLAIALIKKK